MRELLGLIQNMIGRPLAIDVDPANARRSDRSNLQADVSLARKELNWRPVVAYEQGLELTLRSELGWTPTEAAPVSAAG